MIKLVLLVITISIIAMCKESIGKQQGAMKAADIFALKSAFTIKEHIEASSACPEALSMWDDAELDHSNRKYVQRGNEHGWYRVLYRCNPDLSFSVAVLYSFDSETFFSGAENGEIQIAYGHFSDRKHIYVKDRNEIIDAIAKIYE